MELREVAEALYTGDPAEFVAQRNTAAGKADKALAKEIRALRKPSTSAAAVNALVRAHPDLVDDILAVGDRMREAFADRDRDEIRSLTGERQRLLQKALQSAGSLSPVVQREVEDTLQAAVIDAAAAAAVRSGMLVRAIESTGVDQVDVADAVALPVDVDAPAPARAGRATSGRRRDASSRGHGADEAADKGADEAADEADAAEEASRRRERERRIRTAEKALERASAEAERLDDELDEEVDRRTDLEAERDSLSRRLERAQEELAESRAAERELRRRITNAQSALRDAQKALRAARDD